MKLYLKDAVPGAVALAVKSMEYEIYILKQWFIPEFEPTFWSTVSPHDIYWSLSEMASPP
jgi:hypothetical protein